MLIMEKDQRTAKMTIVDTPKNMVFPLNVSSGPNQAPEASLAGYIASLPQPAPAELVNGFSQAGFTWEYVS